MSRSPRGTPVGVAGVSPAGRGEDAHSLAHELSAASPNILTACLSPPRNPCSRTRCHATKLSGTGSRSPPREPAARLRFPHPPSAASPWQGLTRTIAMSAPVATRVDPNRTRRPGSQEGFQSCGAIGMARRHRPVWLVVNAEVGACVIRGRLPASGAGTGAGRLRWVDRESDRLRRWLAIDALRPAAWLGGTVGALRLEWQASRLPGGGKMPIRWLMSYRRPAPTSSRRACRRRGARAPDPVATQRSRPVPVRGPCPDRRQPGVASRIHPPRLRRGRA